MIGVKRIRRGMTGLESGQEANKPFDHEARMKELLARQAQLNAALDLDKNETQVAPTAEDDIGLGGDLPQPTPPPTIQRSAPPAMRL
jgi:hypothetical protein